MKNKFTIRELTPPEFNRAFDEHADRLLLGKRLHYKLLSLLSKRELEKAVSIQLRLKEISHLYLGLFHGKNLIGWTCGFEATADCFYISNSVIFAEYRGRGLHVKLLNRVIQTARKRGYKILTCHHYPTLSQLIAKKLDMGFYITGYETSDIHGTLLKMTYFLDSKRRRNFLKQSRS